MARKKIETIINEKIVPYSLNEKGKAQLAQTIRKYPYELLIECIDIGIKQYFRYDEDGALTQESVDVFLNKLGGIAFNKSQNPIDQEISHIKNKCKKAFAYWNDYKADDILNRYILGLRKSGWTENQILKDLQTEVNRLGNSSLNWSQWSDAMEKWIEDINHWRDEVALIVNGRLKIFFGHQPNQYISLLRIFFEFLVNRLNAFQSFI